MIRILFKGFILVIVVGLLTGCSPNDEKPTQLSYKDLLAEHEKTYSILWITEGMSDFTIPKFFREVEMKVIPTLEEAKQMYPELTFDDAPSVVIFNNEDVYWNSDEAGKGVEKAEVDSANALLQKRLAEAENTVK